MPTSEEELAKRTREGWPETQGSPGEASGAAARDTRFKGRTDGQVHRTPLRGWKGSPPLPPPAAEAENFRENSPRGHLQSLPIHLPCHTPRYTKSCGPRLSLSHRKPPWNTVPGVRAWGDPCLRGECCAHSPRLLPLRQPGTGSTWRQRERKRLLSRPDRKKEPSASTGTKSGPHLRLSW